MEPLSVSLSVRSACVLFFHSSPLSLPGKGRNSDFAALGAVGETRPRHTEFYMTLLQRITMMYEGELVPYCAEACLSSLTSSCTHQPPPPPALLANPSIVPNQGFALYRSCSLPQHDPPTYQLIRIDGFSVSEWSCSRIKPCQCHMINGSRSYQGGWISVLINARAQIPGFPPVDRIQIIFIEWAEERGWQRHWMNNVWQARGTETAN